MYEIDSVNPLYLGITRANGCIKDKGIKTYLVFNSTDENKELLKNYNVFFNGIRDKIKEINNECDYEKDYSKNKFNSDDDLPLNKSLKNRLMTITIRPLSKSLKNRLMTITIRHVFEEDGKLYPQVFLNDTLYEL